MYKIYSDSSMNALAIEGFGLFSQNELLITNTATTVSIYSIYQSIYLLKNIPLSEFGNKQGIAFNTMNDFLIHIFKERSIDNSLPKDYIGESEYVTIPLNRQYIIKDSLKIDGIVEIDGALYID